MSMPVYAGAGRNYRSSFRNTSSGTHDWWRLHAAAIDRSFVRQHPAGFFRAPADRVTKLLFDLFLAALLVIGLSPALLCLAALVRKGGGKVIYGHKRIGAYGRVFTCWKFRTMVPNADQVLARVLASDASARAEWEKDFKLKDDPRITRVGRILRTTSLDELPQLFNVLKGEMSLVGPRPIVADEIRRYGAAFHDYTRCRPGITGAWQVSGRNDVDYGTRVRLDQDYARHWSFLTDCTILLRTAVTVLKRSGAY
jgi:exopolysaccharide production protein ExoY